MIHFAAACAAANSLGLLPSFCLQADFIGPRRGLTSDDKFCSKDFIEGVTEFIPHKILKVKSKERPSSGDRSFEGCQTRYPPTYAAGMRVNAGA